MNELLYSIALETFLSFYYSDILVLYTWIITTVYYCTNDNRGGIKIIYGALSCISRKIMNLLERSIPLNNRNYFRPKIGVSLLVSLFKYTN